MHFFGKQSDDERAVDKVHQWLADTAENVPESLGDTSIARLSKQASAELNMPQSTAIRALYDLRDSGQFVRVKGNTRSGKYQVKPVVNNAVPAVVDGYVRMPQPRAQRLKARKITVNDSGCAQEEPAKVKVQKDEHSITITIKIDF